MDWKKPFSEMTFEEKMQQVNTEHDDKRAAEIEEIFLRPPIPPAINPPEFGASVIGRYMTQSIAAERFSMMDYAPRLDVPRLDPKDLKATHDKLKELVKGVKVTSFIHDELLLEVSSQELEKMSRNDLVETVATCMRIAHNEQIDVVFVKGDGHGRPEERYRLEGRRLRGDSDSSQRRLPGDQGVPGDGGADRGPGG